MPFRSLAASPEDLTKLSTAFDAAWIAINEGKPIDPLAVSGCRERLGAIIVSLWQADPDQELAKAAVAKFLESYEPSIVSPSRV